ncbi:MAG: TrkA family potassium uptake protein [Brevinematales bacterium]|nr:TrkA family potassium uptake protein [Brevinematales bacterium]
MRETESKRDFLVIGLGRFGTHLAENLIAQGVPVVLLDKEEKNLRAFREKPNCFLKICDATKEEELANVIEDSQIQSAVVCIGEDITASVLIALILKNHNVLNIYARANTREHAEILRLLGVTEIIEPEKETAQKWARTLVNQGELIVSYQELSNEYVVVEVAATTPIMYMTIEELDLRQKFHLNIVGIRHRYGELDEHFSPRFSEVLSVPPDPKYAIQEGDRLIVAGKDEHIQRFKDFLLGKSS